jgi:hypothetical protein
VVFLCLFLVQVVQLIIWCVGFRSLGVARGTFKQRFLLATNRTRHNRFTCIPNSVDLLPWFCATRLLLRTPPIIWGHQVASPIDACLLVVICWSCDCPGSGVGVVVPMRWLVLCCIECSRNVIILSKHVCDYPQKNGKVWVNFVVGT